MDSFGLENIDPDDIEDVLIKIEKSFELNFSDKEFYYVKTFGEMYDHLQNKIALEHTESCTTQQAFYKLRSAFSNTLKVEKKKITPDMLLSDILPEKNRKKKVKKIESHLGFKVNILNFPILFGCIMFIFFILSIFFLILGSPMGLGFIIFTIGGVLTIKRELRNETLGNLAKRMTKENYCKSRRNPKTCNKKEIENLLLYWFTDYLAIEKHQLSRDSKFGW